MIAPAQDILDIMPPQLIEEFRAFIFDMKPEGVNIAAVNPNDASLRNFARSRFGEKISWFQTSAEDIAEILKLVPRNIGADVESLAAVDGGTNGSTTKIIDRIIKGALEERASDIHVEPLRSSTVIRFRIDGVLHTVVTLPRDFHSALIARLKILANMKIDEYRRPQDGRIEPENLPQISLRVSTIPTLYGEKVAMRLLDDSHRDLLIAKLGFSPEHESIIRRNIEKPFGMIVSSGPTGSGKTTTLYALLNLLKRDGINISTLEDPVEYPLGGVNQIQIDPRFEFTFSSGLRALLRQDPDVIMVGEIRDSDTVIMASSAALTGHLVLTTIHTNDAPSVFTRFLEMKVEDFVAGSVVNLVIGQRLVRKVCDNCAVTKKLDKILVAKIKERRDVVRALEAAGKSANEISNMKVRTGRGCALCLKTGYSGRIGIYEVLELDKTIHDLVLAHSTPERIKEEAEKLGFRDMLQDGVQKIFNGITTFEEVLRTTKST